MDGSGGGRTAWMYDDWNLHRTDVDRGNRGYPLIEPELYRRLVRRFDAAGLTIGTHAIGDRAIDWVVDSYAAALYEHPARDLRHSIIHANVPSDHALDVMTRLQRDYGAGVPEAQGPFTWWIGDNYAGNFGPARSQRLNPFATYLRRGLVWAGGSDYDVTPLPARYGLWSSVVRQTLQGTYGRTPFGQAESVDIHVALRSYTGWAAKQLYLEDETGSLEVGKSADIAVWDQNPYTLPARELEHLRCVLTLYRGKVVWAASWARAQGLHRGN
jgi:predicted amidohydrolase YtcJ